MSKTDTRISLASDLDAFLAQGGIVEILKSKKVRTNAQARGKQKASFGWSAPVNRPCVNWDIIETA